MDHREPLKTSRELTYTVVLEPAPEGGYVAYFPDVPGAVTQGETLDEARQMAVECLELHLEALEDAGEALPQPGARARDFRLEDLTVTLKRA